MIKRIYQLIKLFSSPRKEFYLFLKDLIGYYPINTKLYDIAFTHKSVSETDTLGYPINNERLEFLGDAVIGSVVAELLYNRFPQRGEGFMTQMRSKLVNRAFLSQLTYDTGLHQFLKSKTIGTNQNSHILGDAFEALIGAIYLDKGYEKAKYVLIKKFLNSSYVDLNELEELDENFKSQLIEWGQKFRKEIQFNTNEVEDENPKANTFASTVLIDNKEKGKGFGNSKKEAQQNAAKQAIEKIDLD